MDTDQYLEIFDVNREAILTAGEAGLDNDVVGCPGWDVGTLVAHCGAAYTFWNKWIRDRPINGRDRDTWNDLQAERSRRLPGVVWRGSSFDKSLRPPGVIEFARETGNELAERLRELDPSEPVWTIYPPDQTVGFIQRRIAHETTIHRWDAENANNRPSEIPLDLAVDGLNEYFNVVMQIISPGDAPERPRIDPPVSFGFRQSNGLNQWTVTFAGGSPKVTEDADQADVTIDGTAEALLLYVWSRGHARSLNLSGNATLADQWTQFTGTF